MKKHTSNLLLAMICIALPLSLSAEAQNTATDPNTPVNDALKATTLQTIPPPTQDININFPATSGSQSEQTAVLPAGSSWSQLPIGAYLQIGNSLNKESLSSLAPKVYPDSPTSANQAVNGSLTNFKFLNTVPTRNLVAAYPQLSKVAIQPNQLGSWSSCGATTFGQIANSACGDKPIPADVMSAIPISQTGLQSIPYADMASKLNIKDLPASSFPLASNLTFDKILPVTGTNTNVTSLMKVDYLETKIPGQGGSVIKGINSVSGSNRVVNSTCKDKDCDYAVLRSKVQGTSADKANPLNNNLSAQINKPGTTWLDGGIGSFGTTVFNFKEPPGLEIPVNSDYMKLVLSDGNARAGSVKQNLYLAFCVSIAFEKNCSSKFIGPLPVPSDISEKNQAMLLPVNLKPTQTAPTSSPSSFISNTVDTTTSNANPPTQPSSSTAPAYASLFGANTLNSYSPTANISNSP